MRRAGQRLQKKRYPLFCGLESGLGGMEFVFGKELFFWLAGLGLLLVGLPVVGEGLLEATMGKKLLLWKKINTL